MRFPSLFAALIVAGPIGFYAAPASATAYNLLFGGSPGYQGPWCAVVNTGAGNIERDCSFNSIESCRRMVISGNRGFCNQNPAFAGYQERPLRKHQRRHRR